MLMKKLFCLILLCLSYSVYANTTQRDYLNTDPKACETIRFVCPEGQSPFFDSYGCGCQPTPKIDCSSTKDEE